MYNAAAVEQRRCTGVRKDGEACHAWALWDDPRQLCVNHAGRGHTGPLAWPPAHYTRSRTRVAPCCCIAYNWPHRPGSGLCEWPNAPQYRLATPAGTRKWSIRIRRRGRW